MPWLESGGMVLRGTSRRSTSPCSRTRFSFRRIIARATPTPRPLLVWLPAAARNARNSLSWTSIGGQKRIHAAAHDVVFPYGRSATRRNSRGTGCGLKISRSVHRASAHRTATHRVAGFSMGGASTWQPGRASRGCGARCRPVAGSRRRNSTPRCSTEKRSAALVGADALSTLRRTDYVANLSTTLCWPTRGKSIPEAKRGSDGAAAEKEGVKIERNHRPKHRAQIRAGREAATRRDMAR